VPEEPDAQVLEAAIVIRTELVTLVPAEADSLGEQLDQLIARADTPEEDERAAALDTIVEVLVSREPTRARFDELYVVRDDPRGADADVWAGDGMLSGTTAENDDAVVVVCGTCGYANRLPFRPTPDDLPECENPAPPPHPLELD
jgi:hypothetical protein